MEHYDTGGSSEAENKQQILRLSKQITFKNITQFVDDFTQTQTIDDVEYVHLRDDKIRGLAADSALCHHYITVCQCVNRLLQVPCYLNQSLNLTAQEAYQIMEFLSILPQVILKVPIYLYQGS